MVKEFFNKDNLLYNQEIDMEKVQDIPFVEVIDVCTKYINKEISLEELRKWGDKVVFKKYLPIATKTLLVSKVMYSNYYSEDLTQRMIELQMYKFFDILLAYTNIVVEDTDVNVDNYDICNSILGDWLLTYSAIDYSKTIELLNDYMNYNNIEQIVSTGEIINNVSLTEYNQVQKDFMNKMDSNPEMLKDMIDILKLNDPNLAALNDSIKLESWLSLKDKK